MPSIRIITIESGLNYSITTVTMTDGATSKVVSVDDHEGNCHWNSESTSGVTMEEFAMDIAHACSKAVLDVVTGERE